MAAPEERATYVTLPREQFEAETRARVTDQRTVQLLPGRDRAVENGELEVLNDNLRTLLASEPRTLAAFIREHREDFESVEPA